MIKKWNVQKELPVLFNIQYLVEPPLFIITEIIRLGRDLYNFLIVFLLNWCHSCCMHCFNSFIDKNCRPLAYTARARSAQIFSIMLRSGDFAGQSKILIVSFAKNDFTILAV